MTRAQVCLPEAGSPHSLSLTMFTLDVAFFLTIFSSFAVSGYLLIGIHLSALGGMLRRWQQAPPLMAARSTQVQWMDEHERVRECVSCQVESQPREKRMRWAALD